MASGWDYLKDPNREKRRQDPRRRIRQTAHFGEYKGKDGPALYNKTRYDEVDVPDLYGGLRYFDPSLTKTRPKSSDESMAEDYGATYEAATGDNSLGDTRKLVSGNPSQPTKIYDPSKQLGELYRAGVYGNPDADLSSPDTVEREHEYLNDVRASVGAAIRQWRDLGYGKGRDEYGTLVPRMEYTQAGDRPYALPVSAFIRGNVSGSGQGKYGRTPTNAAIGAGEPIMPGAYGDPAVEGFNIPMVLHEAEHGVTGALDVNPSIQRNIEFNSIGRPFDRDYDSARSTPSFLNRPGSVVNNMNLDPYEGVPMGREEPYRFMSLPSQHAQYMVAKDMGGWKYDKKRKEKGVSANRPKKERTESGNRFSVEDFPALRGLDTPQDVAIAESQPGIDAPAYDARNFMLLRDRPGWEDLQYPESVRKGEESFAPYMARENLLARVMMDALPESVLVKEESRKGLKEDYPILSWLAEKTGMMDELTGPSMLNYVDREKFVKDLYDPAINKKFVENWHRRKLKERLEGFPSTSETPYQRNIRIRANQIRASKQKSK